MADLYATLGVPKAADEAAIKKAYRKLAKELHPDRNKDNPAAAERFKAVSSAYDILSDPKRRGQYDRGEIDWQGNPAMPPGFDGFRRSRPAGGFDPRAGAGASRGSETFETDFGDLLSELFAAGEPVRGRTSRPARKGTDIAYRLSVPLAEAALARPQRITLRSGKTVDLKLPNGVEDGQQLRLPGQGEPGPGGAGDALVTLAIQPDPRFTREGDDVRTELMVPLEVAMLGGKVRAPTPEGEVMLTVAPGTSSGRLMRLKGKGWTRKDGSRGDLMARVLVEVRADDVALAAFLRERQGAAEGA